MRANIDALKRCGCTDILAISAIGSLQEHLPPGHFVAVDQFIDRTFARVSSFFGPGLTAHVSMADPVCARLSAMAADAVEAAGGPVARGGEGAQKGDKMLAERGHHSGVIHQLIVLDAAEIALR